MSDARQVVEPNQVRQADALIRAFSACMGCFATVWFLFLWGLAAVGAWLVWDQQAKVTSFQPVPATVMASRVDQRQVTSTDSTGVPYIFTSYTPVVEYRYRVAGRTYTGDDVYPVSVSASEAAAWETLRRFPVGRQFTAYYNPRNPAQAYLLRRITLFPYLFIWGAMAMVLVGCLFFPLFWPGRGAGRGLTLPPALRWMALAALAVAIVAAGHYFWLSARAPG